MSANHTASGRSATKERPSKFGATGRSWRLAGGSASPPSLGLQAHVTHQPFDPASRVPVPFPAQFSVDPGRAIDPALGGKDAADVPAQLGFRLRAVLSGWGSAPPPVKARDACADDPAQRRNGMVGSLGCHKGKLGHAIPLAKKAAALRKIKFSSSSRFTSRLRRSISASSAFFWARASAEPAASCSLRHWLSWPGLTSSSAAISASGLPLSFKPCTDWAYFPRGNRLRGRLCSISPSWGARVLYRTLHSAPAGSPALCVDHA